MIFEKIREIICEQFAAEKDAVSRDTHFVDDLGADSLDVVELTMAIEEEFDIPEMDEDALRSIETVGDLVEYVSKHSQA